MFNTPLEGDEQVQVLKMKMALELGWTLEYIDSLSVKQMGIYIAIKTAEAKITENERAKSKNKGRH